VGESRLVTKFTVAGENANWGHEEEATYWYHSDHLGSAQLVTKKNGTIHERIEYTPYGELWVEANYNDVDKLPFRFTGKEFDEETGFYYYGARYLDPRLSRWISTDPALGEYIPGAPVNEEARKRNGNLPGMGGIYNTINLNLYHYAGNNPLKYIDPTGMWGEEVHLTLTESWATEVLGADKARKVAVADNNTDKGSKGPMPWQNQSYHFNTNGEVSGSEGDSRIIRSEKHLQKAINFQNKANDLREKNTGTGLIDRFNRWRANRYENKALKNLGQGLHALQDVSAHEDEYVSKSWYGYSHADPRNPFNNGPNLADDFVPDSERAQTVERDTKDYLNRFKEGTE